MVPINNVLNDQLQKYVVDISNRIEIILEFPILAKKL